MNLSERIHPWLLIFSVLLIPGTIIVGCLPQTPGKLFGEVSSRSSNIDFKNTLRESEEFNVLTYGYFYNGGGVAIGDLNNDGLPDIYLTGNMKASHLYLNKGDLKFEEIAKDAGVEAAGLWNTGVTMADVNNDGWLDIYVCRSAAALEIRRKNLLFINNHDLTFTERAAEFGLDDGGYSTQAAFFDYDKDGDLDMYLLNHSTQEYAGFSNLLKSHKTKVSRDYGDKLYRNELIQTETESFGRFLDVTHQSGILNTVLGFGLGVAIADINQDSWLDIYVSNDYNEEDYCYINQGDGTFKESIRMHFDHTSLFSMGSDIADINNDGLPEVYTLDMLPEENHRIKMTSGSDNFDKKEALYNAGFHFQTMRNMLHLHNGDGSFSEIGQLAGVSNTDWSWAPLFADFDQDGWKDLFVSNGYKSDYTNMAFMSYAMDQVSSSDRGSAPSFSDLLSKIPSISLPNYTFKNNGDLTFTNMSTQWGLDKASLSNGVAYADLDLDGDLDLVVNNVNEVASLYRNNSESLNDHHYVQIQLRQLSQNKFGVGSTVKVTAGELTQYQMLMPTRGFQSSVEPNLTFGLADNSHIDKIEVTWPDGQIQELKDRSADQIITIHYNPGTSTHTKNIANHTLQFKDITSEIGLAAKHIESDYNDFKREPLLLHMMSTQGPTLSVGDANGDGREDLYLGGAAGSPGQLFLQTDSQQFEETQQPAFINDQSREDTDVVFIDIDNDNDLDIYVASGSNEYQKDAEEYQDRLFLNDGKGQYSKLENALPEMLTSTSCITTGDIDNDGDLDLFVGSRLIPGQYPRVPRSYILENDGLGRFVDITSTVHSDLSHIGMVTDALWIHLNDDDYLDLIVVGEWMPIKIFINDDGQLREASHINNAATDTVINHQGWWNCISAADMDNDGDIDFVVGNFGQNSQIKVTPQEPVSVIAKDFDDNGTLDPIFTYYLDGRQVPIPPRDDLLAQLPSLKKKFDTYESYAAVEVSDLFTPEELIGAQKLEARYLNSVYVENLNNGTFNIHPLPIEAQIAPTYSVLLYDFNQDGYKDILLGGNFTDAKVQFGRYDANKGALLFGDGIGNFKIAKNRSTGLKLRGNVRDIKTIKIGDESNNIVIGKNDEEIQIINYQLKK